MQPADKFESRRTAAFTTSWSAFRTVVNIKRATDLARNQLPQRAGGGAELTTLLPVFPLTVCVTARMQGLVKHRSFSLKWGSVRHCSNAENATATVHSTNSRNLFIGPLLFACCPQQQTLAKRAMPENSPHLLRAGANVNSYLKEWRGSWFSSPLNCPGLLLQHFFF